MLYDVLVIGGGTAGYYCARQCVRNGFKVALVEKHELGGTGFRWGCLPTKIVLDMLKTLNETRKLGIEFKQEELNRQILKSTKDRILKIKGKMERDLKSEGVEIFYGKGRFINHHVFQINNSRIEAEKIIIATGSRPRGIGNITVDGKTIITHKEVFQLDVLPAKLVIAGGDVEGIEFASIFSRLGTDVTVVEQEDEILKGYDRDLKQPLLKELNKHGVTFNLNTKIIDIQKTGEGIRAQLSSGGHIEADQILLTAGREPNIPSGLKEIGVNFNKHGIPVDENLRSNLKHIYAAGDVNGICGMSSAAIHQGIEAAQHLVGEGGIGSGYYGMPRALFSIPEIAGVGQMECDLVSKGINYEVKKYNLADTWRGISKNIDEGMIKVLFDREENVLGIWIVGGYASELIGLYHTTFKKGIKLRDIRENLYIHPSMSEGILEAVLK